MVPAGGRVVADLPLLGWQTGTRPDLVLLWNDLPAMPHAVDVVLHLHGYSPAAAAMNLLTEKLPISGLDFGDPDETPGASAARIRPTLAILPRGRFFGGSSGFGYDFPVLMQPGGTWSVVDAALDQLADAAAIPRPGVTRRLLTAHSGGGAALMPVAAQFAPDEIHVFDGLYSDNPALAEWAHRRIADDASQLASVRPAEPSAWLDRHGGALRVFYIAGTGTEPASLVLAQAVAVALDAVGRYAEILGPRYRVEPVTIPHFVIPRRLGWHLLADVAAPVAGDTR